MKKCLQNDSIYAIGSGIIALLSFIVSAIVSSAVHGLTLPRWICVFAESSVLPGGWVHVAFWISFVAVAVVPPLCKFTFAKCKWAVTALSILLGFSLMILSGMTDMRACTLRACSAFAAALAIAVLTAYSWRMSGTPASIAGTVFMQFALAHLVFWPTNLAVVCVTSLANATKEALISVHLIFYALPIALFALSHNFVGCFCLPLYLGLKMGRGITLWFPFLNDVCYALIAISVVGFGYTLFMFIKQINEARVCDARANLLSDDENDN